MKVGNYEVDVKRVTGIAFPEDRPEVAVVTLDGKHQQEFTHAEGQQLKAARDAARAPVQPAGETGEAAAQTAV